MRIPQQVSDRLKEAPAQALRAVFAGIGQVLLVADRIRTRAAEANRARSESAARPTRSASNGAAALKDETRWRSLDKTGNVRLLSADDLADDEPADTPRAAAEEAPPQPGAAESLTEAPPAAQPPADLLPAQEPATEEPTTTAEEPAEEPTVMAEEPAPEPTAAREAVLPLPNYDGLTVASLRARLRNLDSPQLRVLIDYEKAHAGRPDVVTMFERRIAKLENGEA
jgi:hypothetical protein